MTTIKIAISMPKELVKEVDAVRKEEDISRSGYITKLVRRAVRDERKEKLKAAYDRVFSDPKIVKEQKETALFFDNSGKDKGQQW